MSLEGTLTAARAAREAYARGEVQDGPVPLPNAPPGGHLTHPPPELGVDGGRAVSGEAEVPTVDARGHPVDRRHPLPERHRQRGVGGVRPHAGELEEHVHQVRHTAPLHDSPRQVPEGLGATDQAERTDHRSDRVGAGTRQRDRVRPPLEEPLVHGGHGAAARSLQEHLGDEDPEGVPLGSPGEPSSVGPPPPQEVPHERPRIGRARHGGHDTRSDVM